MANSEKLVSLIYYNYPPGKQNIGSSYLDTITSIYNMLYSLKDAGYDVGDLPSNVSELEDLMLKCGINVATWAPGELEKLANQSDVILLPVSEYTEWFNNLPTIVKIQVNEGPIPYIGELAKRAVELRYTVTIGDTIDDWYNQIVALLPDDKAVEATKILNNIVQALKNYTKTFDYKYFELFLKLYDDFKCLNISGLTGWGDAPGNVMVVNKNGTDYFVIPGLRFGNVLIAPEPQRGWEADVENLYHCTAVAPTHQYLAAYYYMQTYYPNAMVFTGRHATHEWLPGKEILLSSTDYGSVVVGKVPQLYFYITDGLGEAIQAKRRGFAVLLSHLTSPLAYTNLYANLTVAAVLVEQFLNSNDAKERNRTAKQLSDLIIDNDYAMNLGLSKEEVLKLKPNELVDKVNTFLKSIQSTIYPLGLHAIGQYWNEKDLASTVSVMMSFDFDLENNKGETNLFDEISQYYYSSKYGSLSALEREFVLNKSYDICKALIYWDVGTVFDLLADSNSKFNNLNFFACLNLAKSYIDLINDSISAELNAMIDGLNGKYIPISEGGEIIAKPQIMPTGRNMFQDQSCELPSQEAYEYAKILALLTLSDLNDATEKIIMGIWCVETARDDGALVSTVLYLLGMKPVWTDSPSAGIDDNHDHDDESTTGKKVKNMPEYVKLVDLVRPDGWAKKRIDVTVITSGLFRDLYSSQTIIMDNAFRVALARSYLTITSNKTLMNSEYGPQVKEAIDYIMEGIGYYGVSGAYRESLEDNYVAKHWLEDCLYYLSIGYNSTYAGECAITRIFAPPNGDYGAGISKLVSMSWTWNTTDELADFYLGRMGNMYSKNYWGDTNPLVFLRALSNSDTIVASRNTNQYGVLDNDDFFDYWGGLSMTVEKISGKTPKFNVLMYANRNNAYISSLEEVMYQEIASRYDNPEWIKGMMAEGYSGARYMSNKFITNLYGWQVTRPSAVSDDLWNRVYNTYYKDKYNLGVTDWLKNGNNAYSLISMSGTMLTTIKEGYWNADEATIRDIANTWAQATVNNGVACCDCSCGNIAMMQWAIQYVNPDILAQLLPKLYEATKNPVFLNNTQQNAPSENTDNPSNTDPSTTNPVEGSQSSTVVASNSTTKTKTNSQSSSSSSNSNSQSSTSSKSTDNSQGQSASNIGVNGQSGSPQGKAASDIGENGEAGEVGGDSSQSADVKKSIEINPVTSQSASEVGLSIIAVLGVLCLIGVIGLGYFRNRDEEEEVKDLDKLYDEKII
jgi:cobaltochelatase CobN